jgi:hypothetical protein
VILLNGMKSPELCGRAEFCCLTLLLPRVFHVLHAINFRMNKNRSRSEFKFKLITCLMRGGYCMCMRSCNTAQTPVFLRCELKWFLVQLERKSDIDLYYRKERRIFYNER